MGPLENTEFLKEVFISPLNSRPKKDSEDRRILLDLSFPKGAGVNAGIDKNSYLNEPARVRLPNVDTLVDLIKKKGAGCALFKKDLRRAYRQLPLDPGDIHRLGYKWDNLTYVDLVCPMGMTSSAYICQRVTNAVRFICQKKGINVTNYLADFSSAATW